MLLISIKIGQGCSIEKRKSGIWRIRFRRKNRRKKISLDTTSKIKAIALASDMYERWDRGAFDPWHDVHKVSTVEDALEHYERERGKELKDGGRGNLWVARSVFGDIKYASDITSPLLRQAVYRNANKQTRLSTYSKLSAVLNWLTKRGYFVVNPLNEVERPGKVNDEIKKYYNDEELERFFAAAPMYYQLQTAPKKCKNPYWYIDALKFYLYTGVRREEAPKLTWGNVVWPTEDEPGKLKVKDYKNSRTRSVSLYLVLPLLKRLELDTRISDDPHEVILKAKDGFSPISGKYLGRRMKAIAELAKLPSIGLHGFRHTWAIKMLLAGVSLRSVQKMLGHKSITTTQVYLSITDDDVMREVERKLKP